MQPLDVKSVSATSHELNLLFSILGCSLKFLQLMQHFEHVAVPLAEAVEIFTKVLGVKSIAGDIMR